jgi:hypothetical protein
MSKPEIWIGARGWRHESWVGDFYPEDMPHEWWLAYYSNEFDSVLVPWEYLKDAHPDTLQIWIEEANERFAFFIELSLSASKDLVVKVLEALGPRLGGILLNDITNQDEITSDVLAAADWIEIAKAFAPIAVNRKSFTPSGDLIAQQHQWGCYWRPDAELCHECHGDLGIAEIHCGTIHDPKSLKNILEHCRSMQGPTTIGLFFDGNAPRIEEMRNAIMILQMLG